MERPKIEFEAKVGAKSPPKHSHPTDQWEGFQGVAMVWPHTLINAQDFKSTQNIFRKVRLSNTSEKPTKPPKS
jgi:hypothetical protein